MNLRYRVELSARDAALPIAPAVASPMPSGISVPPLTSSMSIFGTSPKRSTGSFPSRSGRPSRYRTGPAP